eukprot:XP_019080746.1 PREDICTED: probable WRKY transcription factor 72 isoform X2 [Vitis vinifera]
MYRSGRREEGDKGIGVDKSQKIERPASFEGAAMESIAHEEAGKVFDILQQESSKRPVDSAPAIDEESKELELVSLCLGRSSPTDGKRDGKSSIASKAKEDDDELNAGLTLGLDSKFQVSKLDVTEFASNSSPTENSIEEVKEEEAGETWPPSKVLKTMRTGDEVSQQSHVKRARVSVRARCDTLTMNDGCQWRKYGQKIAKGNPCPRAYYRCTVAPSCPVRKQVQRCAEDMSILITTYEGTHNHPLPMSATAMASTTSAAASMLISGSSASQPGLGSSPAATELHGLNFSLPDNMRTRQLYAANSSPFPTITLDLTTTASSSSHFSRFSSSFNSSTPRFPSTSLSFSSSESNSVPTVWGNGCLNYGILPHNKAQIGSLNLGRQPPEHFHQPYMEKNGQAPIQQSLTETLTKVITSDPSFRTVIAAALSSMVSSSTGQPNPGAGESLGQNLKWGETTQAISTNPLSQNGKGCAPGYLNASSSSNSQTGNSILLQPPFPVSIPRSGTSGSAAENRDQNN